MEFLKWARTQWDRSAAVLAAAGGLLALFLGWLGASDNVNPAGQIPYVISGGLVGVGLIALASTLWLSADLRDEWRKLDRLEERLANGAGLSASDPSAVAVDLTGDEEGTPEAPAEDSNPNRRLHASGFRRVQ